MTTINHTLTWDEDKYASIMAECQRTGITMSLQTGLRYDLVCTEFLSRVNNTNISQNTTYANLERINHPSTLRTTPSQSTTNPTSKATSLPPSPATSLTGSSRPRGHRTTPKATSGGSPASASTAKKSITSAGTSTPRRSISSDGKRSRAEIHMVHVTAEEHEAAVVGIRLAVGPTESKFIKQLGPMTHFNDTSTLEGLNVDLRLAIDEVGGVEEFWTYKGSLTTPPCSEGLRWFLPKQELLVSESQMVEILAASRFSHRVEQTVWAHGINL